MGLAWHHVIFFGRSAAQPFGSRCSSHSYSCSPRLYLSTGPGRRRRGRGRVRCVVQRSTHLCRCCHARQPACPGVYEALLRGNARRRKAVVRTALTRGRSVGGGSVLGRSAHGRRCTQKDERGRRRTRASHKRSLASRPPDDSSSLVVTHQKKEVQKTRWAIPRTRHHQPVTTTTTLPDGPFPPLPLPQRRGQVPCCS